MSAVVLVAAGRTCRPTPLTHPGPHFSSNSSPFHVQTVSLDKMTHMVGSYPPKPELQSYTTPQEEAPAGLMSRGTYTVHSLFTDDDKNQHLKWEWCFEIKKDWKD
ncbi:hypothetical protein J6590_026583 [Homalodisca vitripennis]|nr:hypothetical protein J6590_026583 [Homalodisca vitripennis]